MMDIDNGCHSPLRLGNISDELSSEARGGSLISSTVRLAEDPPFSARTIRWKRHQLSNVWARYLDRVHVLGNHDHGHTGCVNALSWAQGGELLISSGDDQDIRVWRMDPSADASEYPFSCQSVIHTGHTHNVFNAQMLPHSCRIATVSGDKEVRVFDVGGAVGHSPTGSEMTYATHEACIRILRCHTGRTKRIVTEDSPDLFLTVAEDGTVRQHDLRTFHVCGGRGCPAPLVKLSHDLSTIALSPLTPYQFVVGGESPFAHLYDRRHIGRYLYEEWGMSPAANDATTCVRKFSRHSRAPGEPKGGEHITGARMSAWNGHELLLSFNSDAVYLYSTKDEPGNGERLKKPSVLAPNMKLRNRTGDLDTGKESTTIDIGDDHDSSSDSEDEHEDLTIDAEEQDGVPAIYPRARFAGHCNVRTIKDVNFLGPYDEYVTSGSDDGNFFLWDKSSGELVDILEGDGSVVNVIEGHPSLPLVAVSGIDATVKLFAPSRGRAEFSRVKQAINIVKNNARTSRRGLQANARMQIAHLFLHYSALASRRSHDEDGEDAMQCINQ
ncbi:WD40 repeat-like protein [Pisolithus orientalis]|uniref:WD40 repeat-like protein n=1 Tax=Pisolithus orientalis TaxID=936130 RepID=UPI0022242F33|nr:WD40 repeat-like protein [Pisolithus orientalis]KAI6035413.1 WD40 repeat-like protein [Pisolithus orientalis]